MASLSLPRVLQLKRNAVDAEREQFEKYQTLAIQKAVNSTESPVKEKHVRSTIIGTFHDQSAVTYWMVALRLPLQDNRIAAWKFCHVTHKLLREGHPACIDDSQRHAPMIDNLGKLWMHLRDDYGKLIQLYCALLVGKLAFHSRNPRFPGHMQLTAEELDAIAENDVNNYFQLCVELFDYMDDILNLQAAVFESVGVARVNSMTGSGQCRLAALIPCAQDSSHLYDCNVRLLFRLHAALPADTLAGHRDRFRQQFKKLSAFYKHASSLQYFRNLLSLPVLPTNPPNFLLQSDFGTYVAPVVSVPEPVDEPDAVAALVDTSDTMSQATSNDVTDAFDAWSPPPPDPLLERDKLIDHLQRELKRMRTEALQMSHERNSMLDSMRERTVQLDSQLDDIKSELEKEKKKYMESSAETPVLKQKLTETQEKAKVIEEKFQKLKTAYTQLREEHITLIRQKAEVDKVSANLRAAAAHHESAKAALQQALNDKTKDVELLQQNASSSEEIEAYKTEISNLRADLESIRSKETELETLRATMETLEIEHKTSIAEQEEKLTVLTSEHRDVVEALERVKMEKGHLEEELSKVKEEFAAVKEKSAEDYKKALDDKEAAVKQLSDLKQQYKMEKEVSMARLSHAEDARVTAECGLQDLLQQTGLLEADLNAAKMQLEIARNAARESNTKMVNLMRAAALDMVEQAIAALDSSPAQNCEAAANRAAKAFDELANSADANPILGEGSEDSVAVSWVTAAQNSAQLSAFVAELANGMADTDVAEKLLFGCREFLSAIKRWAERGDAETARGAGRAVRGLRGEAEAVMQAGRGGELRPVDAELAEMDDAVQRAAAQIEEMLAASRSGDTGVQLEVNSAILGACTQLMSAVRALAKGARALQAELSVAGAGLSKTTPYARNPQWAEGLVSAAKAVVLAAKTLVSSADLAVSGGGRFEGVCAAAHEVAGSTAQLVAASRVRAPPNAPRLAELGNASRAVAAATGAVLAAVRAASALRNDHEALDTSSLTLGAARRLEMESRVRALELEAALEAERRRLAALRKAHYRLAHAQENGGDMINGEEQ